MIFKNQHFVFLGLFILSFIICLDLLLGAGEPATFDGPIHITNIAQFYLALKDGDLPVSWANNFSNYGSPIPLVAQQLPAYTGALLMFITHDALIAYKIIIFTGHFLTTYFMYLFLRRHVGTLEAFTGAAILNFSAYRIINVYIRGAGPEILSMIWMPVILIGIDKLIKKQKKGKLITIIGLTGSILTHPLVFVAFQVVLIPYIVLNWASKKDKQILLTIATCYVLALSIGAYYLFPLVLEMKYFVISKKSTQLIPNQFLGWKNYFSENWLYYGKNDIFVRANIIIFGLIESLLLISSLGLIFLSKKSNRKNQLVWILISVVILVLLTLPVSQMLYLKVPYMDSLQFPWRMLGPLSIFPPIIAALWLEKIKSPKLKQVIAITLVSVLAISRIPEAYGKNNTLYPPEHYRATIKNLYFDEMNTLWTGSTETYPVRTSTSGLISGDATITVLRAKNSLRSYHVMAQAPSRLVDYTFYFPGWTVYVDGQKTPIEFQDEKYRGVITYMVPPGEHHVLIRFEPTKVRMLGDSISLVGFVAAGGYIYFSSKDIRIRKIHRD